MAVSGPKRGSEYGLRGCEMRWAFLFEVAVRVVVAVLDFMEEEDVKV